MINIDFETRSKTNLLTDGAYNYLADPSTEVICMAWAQDGGKPQLWHPGDEIPACFMTS
jgi:DNA polymerase bacteriophage-type